MRLRGYPPSPRSPGGTWPLGRNEGLRQHPGTRCFFQSGANPSRWLQSTKTRGAGRLCTQLTLCRAPPPGPDPTPGTQSPRRCTCAGAAGTHRLDPLPPDEKDPGVAMQEPPAWEWGPGFAIRGLPAWGRGPDSPSGTPGDVEVSASYSPGTSALAAAIARPAAPRLPIRPGRPRSGARARPPQPRQPLPARGGTRLPHRRSLSRQPRANELQPARPGRRWGALGGPGRPLRGARSA